MITLKSPADIEKMRRAGKVTAKARALAGSLVRPGISTAEINQAVEEYIRSEGAAASFAEEGFPAAACISVNDEIIHGVPGKRVLRKGDIVSIDVGAFLDGFHGDCCATFACGTISRKDQRLIDVTRQSFFEGIRYARNGCRVGDIGAAVQEYVESQGYSVVREYVGHGVGRLMHEEPEIPNYGRHGHGIRLLPGMVIAVEPMVNAGGMEILSSRPGEWVVRTRDGQKSAHYENTVLITDGEPEILTAPAI